MHCTLKTDDGRKQMKSEHGIKYANKCEYLRLFISSKSVQINHKWNGGYSIAFEENQQKRKSPKKAFNSYPNESALLLCV